MSAVLYAHIPGLEFDEPALSFAGGHLTKLSFDEWIKLESEFEYADRKYATTDPVFWVRDLDTDGELPHAEIARFVHDAVWPVHTAFLLDTRAPRIPTPTLSCCYVAMPAAPTLANIATRFVLRLIGPMEREFIVYGSPLTYPYSAEDLGRVGELCHFIEANRSLDGDVRAGIDVLEETARPDSWYGGDAAVCQLHGFVRCMAATESLLLLPKDEGGSKGGDGNLTQTFGRHAAALFAASIQDRDQAANFFADLYRFRSELMHGRLMPDQKDSATATKLATGRQLLRNVIHAALVLRKAMPDARPLGRFLEEAWHDLERQRALGAILVKGINP